MSKSIFHRISMQIPEEELPAFLAATFDISTLELALAIARQLAEQGDKPKPELAVSVLIK